MLCLLLLVFVALSSRHSQCSLLYYLCELCAVDFAALIYVCALSVIGYRAVESVRK